MGYCFLGRHAANAVMSYFTVHAGYSIAKEMAKKNGYIAVPSALSQLSE